MISVVELFSGIGAQAEALREEGIEYTSIVAEIDPHAHASYEAIHGPTVNLGDVRQIEHLPDCDLLTYSFPCQDLSIAGLRKGMSEGSGTRSSMLWEVGRLLRDAVERERPPEVLLMENVSALLHEANLPDFKRWISILTDLGYTSSYRVLNAKDFGVPQNRERVFMVSMRDGRLFEFPQPCPDGRVLKDILEPESDVPDSCWLTEDKIARYEAHRIRHESQGHGFGWPPTEPVGDAFALTQDPTRDSQNFVIVCGDLHDPTHLDNHNRVYSPQGVAPTLNANSGGGVVPRVDLGTTPPDGIGSMDDVLTRVREGARIRFLTTRECWRLMGFPDDAYDRASKVVSSSQLYKQAGNSICVPVLRAIFRALYKDNAWHLRPVLESFGEVA